MDTAVPERLESLHGEEYLSLTLAEKELHQYALQHGFALTKKKFVKDKHKDNPTIRRQDFKCAKGGRKRGEGVKRQTGTRMTECPYEVRVLRTDYGTWTVQVKEPSHNHELVEPSAFPYHRRPTEDQKTRIRSLHASGVGPRFIVASILEQTPESLISLRDVYDEIARGRKERLGDLTPIEVLVMELQYDEEWAVHYCTDGDGHINLLFFAPQEAIELAQASPDVIFIDATYRTNRYNMPLIHFLAVTPIGRTASIAMCFVASESEAMYRIAVSQFKDLVMGDARVEVFLTDDDTSLKNALAVFYPDTPQLLCIWHVNKNVETKVNTTWKISTTSDDANKANKELRQEFMANWTKAS
jgi:hypothetical protein